METFGYKVKSVREEYGVSLEDAASITGIRLQHLQALERDDFDALPDRDAVEGYLLTYAGLLRVDPQLMIDDYVRACESRPPAQATDEPEVVVEQASGSPKASRGRSRSRGPLLVIAGSVLVAYVILLGGSEEATRIVFAKHLMIASVLSAPAAIVMAKLVVPETEQPPDEGHVEIASEARARTVIDAAAVGTTDGLRLAVNVAAMLISFIALLALINWPLEAFSDWRPIAEWRSEHGFEPFSVQGGLGYVFAPLAFLMGVPWDDCAFFGPLLGEKLVVTELIAYGSLGEVTQMAEPTISMRTAHIATYALCGFANLPSIGIQIGGIAALAPDRRADLASLGLRAMIAGALASWCTACVASLFLPL